VGIHETTAHASKTPQKAVSVNWLRGIPSKDRGGSPAKHIPATHHAFSQIPIWHGGDPSPVTTPATPEPTVETTATTSEATPAETTPVTAETPATTAEALAPPSLTWEYKKRHKWDALWWFNGEKPSGFSVTARLEASGYGDPANLDWQIVRGSDKVAFQGASTGENVILESKKGSSKKDDVEIQVREGTATDVPSYTGKFTVRTPHRLAPISTTDFNGCPSWASSCPSTCAAHWTEIKYRIFDNVSGTIVGATVNENFPSAKTDEQTNDWVSPASFSSTPYWENTNGTFIDYWSVWCGTPAPVSPTDPGANTRVDKIPHEFYVGSKVAGKGVRVQKHNAHRYLGYTRHENITTPAP
jgi:hypothetical protein